MSAASRSPSLSDPDRVALLLDFDGTLVDIAPAPDLVVVPDTLRGSLQTLHATLGGALAVITGRTVADIDHFLPGIPEAVAAEHGAVLRRHPGAPATQVDLPPVPERWLAEAADAVAAHDGTRLERKATGFALHYRGAPDAGPVLRRLLDEMVAPTGGRFHVLAAKMAWEIRAHGADKGSAVVAVMAEPPFAGRIPVFIGDDTTDQDGIDAAERLGGHGYLVPDVFGEPEDVREWLRRLAVGEPGAWGG